MHFLSSLKSIEIKELFCLWSACITHLRCYSLMRSRDTNGRLPLAQSALGGLVTYRVKQVWRDWGEGWDTGLERGWGWEQRSRRPDEIQYFYQFSIMRHFIRPPRGKIWYTTFKILKFCHQNKHTRNVFQQV